MLPIPLRIYSWKYWPASFPLPSATLVWTHYFLPQHSLHASLHTALQDWKNRQPHCPAQGEHGVNPYWRSSTCPVHSLLQNANIVTDEQPSQGSVGEDGSGGTENSAEGASMIGEGSPRDRRDRSLMQIKGVTIRGGGKALGERLNPLYNSSKDRRRWRADDNQLCHPKPDAGSQERASVHVSGEQRDSEGHPASELC